MRFSSIQIKGQGRGRTIGFPTINLQIPQDFKLQPGVYAVKVFIGDEHGSSKKEFPGAMHYGPVPTFNEPMNSLEVFLIDTKDTDIPQTKNFEIETIQFVRPVQKFLSGNDLSKQIDADVTGIKKILNLS